MIYLSIITLLAAFVAVLMQQKRDLLMFQQNSYRSERYNKWMNESGDNVKFDRLLGFALFFLALIPGVKPVISMPLMLAASLFFIYKLGTEKYKKPLVFTNRAKRIYGVAIGVSVLFLAAAAFSRQEATVEWRLFIAATFAMLIYAASSLSLLIANWLLKPVESSINQKYYDEAAKMLASKPDMTIIGVTGSYGKTSTKHYLNAILSEQFDVLMTPGNFNTTLGVIRTVREHMKPYNEVFIVEMGAKQKNDIKEICDLVHPTIGIITAVGPQHLESFKTIENVQATKFELADAIGADGLVVLNQDFEYIANRPVDNTRCVRYTAEDKDGADYYAKDITYTPHGTDFSIYKGKDKVIDLHTKLVGRCNVSNLLAAVIVAMQMGVPTEKIKYAVERIGQVEHRLSIKHTPAGITIIDDAYNSNPVGSQMALEVLSGMTDGKRIIITPGMIELGEDQYELNEKFGYGISQSADIAIIVGQYNRDAIMEGINRGMADNGEGIKKENVHQVDSFNDAQQLMLTMAQAGDTVLYENDLPDTFK